MISLKSLIPNPVRPWLRRRRIALEHRLLLLDRVTDWSVLRRVQPYRPDWGSRRGSCVDRFYIVRFLSEHREFIRGRVAEIQSDDYTREFGGDHVTQSDILDIDEMNQRRTIALDLTQTAAAPQGIFDCIICTQTLLLIYDIPAAIRTLHRMLKRGGVLLVTLPGISQSVPTHTLAGADGDWWRFTAHSARRYFAGTFGDTNVEVSTYGNVLTAVAFLHGLVQEELTREEMEYHDPDYQVIIGVKAIKQEDAGAV